LVAEEIQDPDRLPWLVLQVQNVLPVVLAHARATGSIETSTIRYNQRVYGPLERGVQRQHMKRILPHIHAARIYQAWNNAIDAEQKSYAVWLQGVSELFHTETHLPSVLINLVVATL
jgi:hypothetical protein